MSERWRLPLFVTVFAIATAPGVQYVWIWGASRAALICVAH